MNESKNNHPSYIEHSTIGLVSMIVPVLQLHRDWNWRYRLRKPYNLPDLLEDMKSVTIPHETIVVCNSLEKKLMKYIASSSLIDKYCFNSVNVGVARAWNMGAMLAEGEYLCFSNDDVELGKGALEKLVEVLASREDIGQVGPSGGKYRGAFSQEKVGLDATEEADEISGFFFVLRRKVYDLAGGFDVAFTPGGYEETDMSFKIGLLGYKCLVVPHLNIIHHNESGVSNLLNKHIKYFKQGISVKNLNIKNIALFQKKWFGRQADRLNLLKRYAEFESYKSRFPGCRYVEIDANWREKNRPDQTQVGKIINIFIDGKKCVLDVGADPRLFERLLPKLGFKVTYYACDTQRGYKPEYEDFMAIDARASFDVILMLLLIEHLPLEEGVAFMQKAHFLLVPGGILVLSNFWGSVLTSAYRTSNQDY